MHCFHQHLRGGIADWLRRGGRVDLARNFTDDRVDF
jgi:hypothetical protein